RTCGSARHGLELEPGLSWHKHLCPEQEQAPFDDALDAPELQRLALAQRLRMASSATHANAPEREVNRRSRFPEPVCIEPTSLSADSSENGEDYGGRSGNPRATFFANHSLDHRERAEIPVLRQQRHGPGRLDLALPQSQKRVAQRRFVVQGDNRENTQRGIVAPNHLVAQTLDEGQREGSRNRRHHAYPGRTQPRREVDRRDEKPPETTASRVDAHHVLIRVDTLSPNLEYAALGGV